MPTIIVEAHQDLMGNITVAPISAKWRKRFAQIVRENGGPHEDTAFFQDGGPAVEFLENMPARHRRDLESGRSVRFKADAWIVGHWYGYDAHTAAE